MKYPTLKLGKPSIEWSKHLQIWGDTSRTKTATELSHVQKKYNKIFKQMAENCNRTIEKAAFDALSKGTNVYYTPGPQSEDGVLYICGANCPGLKPTASDPLAQYRCPLAEVHCRQRGINVRSCYEPRVLDEQVATEVNQHWGLDDATEEW